MSETPGVRELLELMRQELPTAFKKYRRRATQAELSDPEILDAQLVEQRLAMLREFFETLCEYTRLRINEDYDPSDLAHEFGEAALFGRATALEKRLQEVLWPGQQDETTLPWPATRLAMRVEECRLEVRRCKYGSCTGYALEERKITNRDRARKFCSDACRQAFHRESRLQADPEYFKRKQRQRRAHHRKTKAARRKQRNDK